VIVNLMFLRFLLLKMWVYNNCWIIFSVLIISGLVGFFFGCGMQLFMFVGITVLLYCYQT